MNKHITVLVSNDLEYDQRVRKVCETLHVLGNSITLIGRLKRESHPISRPYEVKRFSLPFQHGALFYASLNIMLFFFLLTKKTDVILANDLDTLLPAFLIAKLRNKKLVYDSHEYFTEAEGLTGRNIQKRIWMAIERWIFPKLKYVYTVNQAIAEIYTAQYSVKVEVVRNVPPLEQQTNFKTRLKLGLPADKRIIVLQGAYIDPDRGAMEAVLAMQFVENALLLIIGSGRDIENIRNKIQELSLHERVWILPRMKYDELRQFTQNADLGLSLDKPIHLNYKYSLPNKIFDYIHAGIPVLVSDLPELRRILEKFEIGLVVPSHHVNVIAKYMTEALNSAERERWLKNISLAKLEYNWQHEELKLKRIFASLYE